MSTESTSILGLETSETGVTTLTLNRPPVNAMSPDLIDELLDAVDALAVDPAVRAVLIRGAGGRYCAGADITVMSDHSRST